MKEVNEEKKTQFRWPKPMSKELLTFLANEVQKGNRPNNSFKSSSYVVAADGISRKFNVKCLPEHKNINMDELKNIGRRNVTYRERQSMLFSLRTHISNEISVFIE